MPQDFSLNQLMAEFTALSAVNQQTVLDWVRTGQDLIDYITEAGSEVDLTEYSGETIHLEATRPADMTPALLLNASGEGGIISLGARTVSGALFFSVGDDDDGNATAVIQLDGGSGNINITSGTGSVGVDANTDLFFSGQISVQVNAPIMYLTATTDEVVGYIQISSDTNSAITIVADSTTLSGDVGSAVILDVDNAHLGKTGGAVGFFGTGPISKPSGVAVTVGAVHAALVSLGLIAA